MPFEELYFAITLIVLLIAVYTDLKSRIVPDKLTYGAMIIALLIKAVESYIIANPQALILSVAGGVIAFIASYALYKTGVWAGGDVKLITAIGFLNPFNYAVLTNFIGLTGFPFTPINLPVFSISMIIYSVFAVLPLGVMISIGAALTHRDIKEKVVKSLKGKANQLLIASVLIAGLKIIIGYAQFSLPVQAASMPPETLIIFPLLLAMLLPNRAKLAVTIIAGAAGLALNAQEFAISAIIVSLPLFSLYSLWKLYTESRETAFKQTIKTKDLEEGMVSDCYIVERSGKIEFVKKPSIKTVINHLINNRMDLELKEGFSIKGKVISGPMHAGGLEEKEAQYIRDMVAKGKAPTTMLVKKTMAFVPAILLAYIALSLTGDLLWNILF